MAIDPVTLAVLQGRLEQIADEMDATLYHSAFNPVIAEAHDACHGLYHPETGATLVQGKSGLPVFVGSMSFAVAAVIAKSTADGGPQDGDVYVFNDPYDGGTHLNDMKLVAPFFRGDQLVCWLASVGHYSDVGGNVPGNYNPVAVESHQEGVRIPPVKLFDAGELRQDIIDIICAISRIPQNAYGDLMGQVNALVLGRQRLHDLLDDYGDDTVREAFHQLTAGAADLMRANIAELPDGVYSADDQLDNDGIVDAPLAICLDATVAGDRLVLDFSRSAPACAGPVNIARSTAIAACYVALKHVFRDVPANAGCMEPVEVVIPEGSVLAAVPPRPVGGYTETILRVMDVIFSALAQAAPGLSNGHSYGTINALSVTGSRDGRRWVMFSFFGGGLGGNPEGDGLHHGNAPLSTATIPPVEILEAAYPVRFTRWGLRSDSGGPGEHRGGVGAVYELELLADQADVFFFGDRGRSGPGGVCGGRPAAVNRFTWWHGGEARHPEMASKAVGIRLARGERVRIESPGGGGYGDPLARAVDAVAADVRAGYVSAEHAVREYAVVVDEHGDVDVERTSARRRSAR